MNIQARPETYITKRGTPAKRLTFKWTEDKIALAAKMWGEGFSSPEIGQRLGVARSSVSAVASKYRDRFPARASITRGGVKLPRISEEWLKLASAMWANGANASDIARATGLHNATVRDRIVRRPEIFPPREAQEVRVSRSAHKKSYIGNGRWVDRVERHHVSGEVHSMPRVSILNGKEG